MHRTKAALTLLLGLVVGIMLGCAGNNPDGNPPGPDGEGGSGGIGGLPVGGSGGGTGGTGGIAVPGDCEDDPGQESCARCLDQAMPSCLMQSAGDCPDQLGAYLLCSNDNGCMKDNGQPNMNCPPCVPQLKAALGCLQSCQPIATCM